ncbi:MAG: O-antigen ligase family protein [Candidatus Omnitrophica bacterium]|nr:O-antigen ligase family protein [Candidatus Omnitrophota bacterium]
MAITKKLIHFNDSFGAFCDRGIVFSLCVLIFVLPASIALLDSFAALAVSFYFVKKIHRIAIDWPSRSVNSNFLRKIKFIWEGLAPPANCLSLPLQLLAFAFFISVLFSQYPTLSLFAFFGKFIKCVFLYFSFIEAFSNEKRIWIFLNFFLLSALITVLSGVFQHYTGKDFLKGHLIGAENFVSTQRINASFFSPNGFGAYLLLVIGLVLHLLFTAIVNNKSPILKGSLGFFLFLLLFCLCWTYSRSSWAGFLIMLFVMSLIDRRKILFLGALLIVFVFIFLPFLNNIRHMRLRDGVSAGSVAKEGFSYQLKTFIVQNGSGRFNFWKKAISIIRSSPVYGTGLNTYARILKRDPPKNRWYAHNCYLQMAAETGLLGLACFLWMLYVLLLHGLSNCRHIKDLWALSLLQGVLSGLFGFLGQSFFDNTFYTVQLGVLMWVFFGLMVALTRLNPMTEFQERSDG